jgi:HEAT repeat protein
LRFQIVLIAALLAAPWLVAAQAPDIAVLIQDLADRHKRDAAMQQLNAIGAPAVPPLFQALEDPNRTVRRSAIGLLNFMLSLHNRANAALKPTLPAQLPDWMPKLVGTFDDTDDEVRRTSPQVVRALAALAGEAPTRDLILPAVLAALDDKQPENRLGAARALAELAPRHALPLEPVMRHLRDPQLAVRERLAFAVGENRTLVAPADAPRAAEFAAAAPALQRLLNDPSRNVQYQAAIALARIEPRPDLVPKLVEAAMRAAGATEPARALAVIQEMGQHQRGIAELERFAARNKRYRTAAQQAIGTLQKSAAAGAAPTEPAN